MPGIDPKVDYAFKKLLGSEDSADLLLSFLNAVLDPREHRRLEHVEILNPFQPQETDLDKFSVLDVKARDESGRLFNIEMQMLNSRLFDESDSLLLGQVVRGSTRSRRKLRGVVSGNFSLHLRFRVVSTNEEASLYVSAAGSR